MSYISKTWGFQYLSRKEFRANLSHYLLKVHSPETSDGDARGIRRFIGFLLKSLPGIDVEDVEEI